MRGGAHRAPARASAAPEGQTKPEEHAPRISFGSQRPGFPTRCGASSVGSARPSTNPAPSGCFSGP